MTIAYAQPPAAPAPTAEVAHHCSNGSRSCFPHEMAEPHVVGDTWTFVPPGASLTADEFFGDNPENRGSGRVYIVTLGRHQFHHDAETGAELYCVFTTCAIQVPVEATFMGFGEQDQVVAYVAEHYPSWEICESFAKRG